MGVAHLVITLALAGASPSPDALVHAVETGRCGERLASDLDAARAGVQKDAHLSQRLSKAAARVVTRCSGDRLGEAAVFQAIKAVAELGPASCDDARTVREVAMRLGHPARAYLASAIQSCERSGAPATPGRAVAAAAPPSRKEKDLTRKALSIPCSSTPDERRLKLNRWMKLTPDERIAKLQDLVDTCTAEAKR
jgi:hypothetical protein